MAEQANQPALIFGALAHSNKLEILAKVEARAQAVMDMAMVDHVLPLEIDVWLPAVESWMEEKIRPCGPEVAGQALSLAIEVLNCKPLSAKVREAYRAIMGSFPADLLLVSVRASLSRERYHVMPTPGALVNAAVADLADRSRRLLRVRLAMRRLELAEARRARQSRHYSPGYQAELDRERQTRARKP